MNKSIAIILIFLSALSFCIGNIPTTEASPKTLVVPDDYSTIQAAINNANLGDSINVKRGVYQEHLTVNKTLSLIGESKDTTIVDGGGVDPGSIIVIMANDVSVNGFTIQNSHGGGNAIWVDGFNSTTISNNIISNNGDGIRILNSHGNIIRNNVVKNNPYTAIGFNWAYNNTIQNNTVVGNKIGIGGGFEPCYSNIFFENNITENSIGIQIDFSNSKFYHNIISNNSKQVDVYTSTFAITWDDGYLSGGNYWSDYRIKYPNATEISNSGIGNTPYVIDANNIDNYPLMKPSVIPEFPSWIILPFITVATLLIVMMVRSKKSDSTDSLHS